MLLSESSEALKH